MPYSFTFDANKCTGCQACQLACTIENQLEPDRSWRQIETFNPRRVSDAPLFHLSLACNHCEHPACMEACPALAYLRDPETGAVLIEEDKCIGCRYCTWACPFDAPRFDHVRGTVTKCTFCNERIKEGQSPACAAYCPTGALGFEWLEDDQLTQNIAGFPTTDLNPAIRMEPLRDGAPADSWEGPRTEGALIPALPASRITVGSEWPLVFLSLTAALLVGLLAAWAAGRAAVGYGGFLLGGATAMLLAGMHLGRKKRAWRAILNVAHSPLSREILFLSLFVGAGTLVLLGTPLLGSVPLNPLPPGRDAWLIIGGPEFAAQLTATGEVDAWRRAVAWIVVVIGILALTAIDRVYRYTHRPGANGPHSADALITGLFLAGVSAGSTPVAGVAGIAKLLLYVGRKRAFHRAGLPVRPLASITRIGIGLLLPPLLWPLGADYALVIAVGLGELIDRLEYYQEMETVTPGRQMVLDLRAMLGGQSQ